MAKDWCPIFYSVGLCPQLSAKVNRWYGYGTSFAVHLSCVTDGAAEQCATAAQLRTVLEPMVVYVVVQSTFF